MTKLSLCLDFHDEFLQFLKPLHQIQIVRLAIII